MIQSTTAMPEETLSIHWGKITTATGSNSLPSSFAMEMMNSPVLTTSLDRLSLI